MNGAPGILVRCGRQVRGGEVDPVDPVPAGEPADEDHDLPGASGVVLREVGPLHDAEAGDVDQAVPGVLVVEEEPARDGRYADPVAVVADPRDHAAHQVPRTLDPGGEVDLPVDGSEAQGVGESDGLGAHAHDVPQDASDTGGRPSVGLDGRGVVVALDPQRVSVLVVEDHDARVPFGEHVVPVDPEHELLEDRLGALVAAVLAPRLSERLELHIGGLPALLLEVGLDRPHLVEGQPEAHVLRQLGEVLVGRSPHGHVAQVERGVAPAHPASHVISPIP